jgi:hypothetical protein
LATTLNSEGEHEHRREELRRIERRGRAQRGASFEAVTVRPEDHGGEEKPTPRLDACVDGAHNLHGIASNKRTGMQNTDNLTEKLKRLPDEHQHEVADFVDFLLSRIPETPDAARVLRETAGIWKGEVDGIVYENALREQWKQRR